jgi:hypothetical protein
MIDRLAYTLSPTAAFGSASGVNSTSTREPMLMKPYRSPRVSRSPALT